MTQEMTQEQWASKFKPITNHIQPTSNFDGAMFETYGDELEFVKAAGANRVWTLLVVDGKGYITSGMHFVNRMGYFIAEVPYEGDEIEIDLGWDADEVNASTIGVRYGQNIAVIAALNNELAFLSQEHFEELKSLVLNFVQKHNNQHANVEAFARQDVEMYVDSYTAALHDGVEV